MSLSRHLHAVVLIMAVFLCGCSSSYVRANAPDEPLFIAVSPKAATELIRGKPSLQIVDVRTSYEFRKGHIPGAIHLSFTDIVLLGSTEGLDQDSPVLLVCAIGHRSRWAGSSLFKKGFKEIYDLDGGMSAWREAGYPSVVSQ